MLNFILERQSVPLLTEPAPSQAILHTIFCAADRAPDHGLLKPWHFLVIEGSAREKLGRIFLSAAQSLTSIPLTPEQQAKWLAMPLRAPMVIVVSARLIPNHKIPEVEQLLAVGASVQNLLLATHVCGYAAMWRTGEMAYNEKVKVELNIAPQDAIAGFIYIGSPVKSGSHKKILERSMSEFVKEWK